MDQSALTLTRGEERLLRSLSDRRARQDAGAFVAEGVRTVEDLLDSRLAVRFVAYASSLEDAPRGQALLRRAGAAGVPLRRAEGALLERLAGTEAPQGVLAVGSVPEHTLETVDTSPERTVVLVVDAVQDPGNLGTLVRTAEALGAVAVVTLPGTVDVWNAKVVRGAMGSVFRLPVAAADWERLSPWLRERSLTSIAAVVGADPLPLPPPRRAALVVGNEGAGISDASRHHAEVHAGIPLRGRAESLNVAAAAAILLHDLLR